jgi:repressor LexA
MTTETPTEPRPLTDRQREVLDFIKANMHLYSPTIREIATALSITSPNGVAVHLEALQRKGYIKRANKRARAIEVLNVE